MRTMLNLRYGRFPKIVTGTAAAASTIALLVGPGVIGASAGTVVNGVHIPSKVNPAHLTLRTVTLTPSTPASGVSPDCAGILSHAQTQGSTKAYAAAVIQGGPGGTTTYFFQVTSTATDGSQTLLEDCAYANGDPSNIKYAAQASNPPFQNHTVFTSLTVTSKDSICDRVRITSSSGVEYTNLVGSSNGKADPSACAPPPNVPEAPAAPLIALAGLAAAGAAAYVWRRRKDERLTPS